MASIAQALLETPLGSVLSAGEAADLAQSASERTIPRGHALFRAGDRSSALYVVLAGSLDVTLGQPGPAATVVATLGPGQIAGELEIMTQSARVATLVASEDTTLLELPASRFADMLDAGRPAAVKVVTTIARALARRLAAANQRIVARNAPAPETAEPAAPLEPAGTGLGAIEDADLQVLDELWK